MKCLTWTMLVYENTALEGWKELLANKCDGLVVSPLHRDALEPHYHVLMSWRQPVEEAFVKELAKEVVGFPVNTCSDVLAWARYVIGKGYPDREQFEPKDLYCAGKMSFKRALAML